MAAERSAKRLGRLLRVRTLQLGLVQAQESAAHAKLDSEAALTRRIAQLADDVAPRAADTALGTGLAAAAHYRERLHASAATAQARVAAAQAGVERARSATQEARRDQSAMEKLMLRARGEAVVREMRALEEAPPSRKRHDPC